MKSFVICLRSERRPCYLLRNPFIFVDNLLSGACKDMLCRDVYGGVGRTPEGATDGYLFTVLRWRAMIDEMAMHQALNVPTVNASK